MKRIKNKFGYTLAEIVTTTAIIGTLAAIAVPNFMRVRMNVNRELVKQHLRVIGQEMNELMNQDPAHQFLKDIFELGGSPGEFTITASLNGIDGKGYTANRADYIRAAGGTSYVFRTCPKDGLFGISGDRCFLLTPGEITETMPWEGDGIAMNIIDIRGAAGDSDGNFNNILAEPTLARDQRIQLMTDYVEMVAYTLRTAQLYYAERGDNALLNGMMPAALFQFMDKLSASSETNINTFKDLLPEIYAGLKNRDVIIAHKNVTVTSNGNWLSGDPVISWLGYDSASPFNCGTACIVQGNYSQIGFQFKENLNTLAVADERRQAAQHRYLEDSQKYGFTFDMKEQATAVTSID